MNKQILLQEMEKLEKSGKTSCHTELELEGKKWKSLVLIYDNVDEWGDERAARHPFRVIFKTYQGEKCTQIMEKENVSRLNEVEELVLKITVLVVKKGEEKILVQTGSREEFAELVMSELSQ